MSKHPFFIFLLSLLFLFCPGKTKTQPPKEIKEAPAPPEVSFSRDVLPILLELGGECHNPENKAGNYALNSYEEIIAGGTDSIPNVIPGKPDSSLLYIYLVKGHPFGVKPDSAKLKMVYNWILQGAKNN
ncbi:MAG: c-type cytochrome domain-containing protein [candidate division WOR-3 bacterium]